MQSIYESDSRIENLFLVIIKLIFSLQQHPEGPSYMTDVVSPPFTPSIWNQEQPPPMVSYPEIMGFPCSDLGTPHKLFWQSIESRWVHTKFAINIFIEILFSFLFLLALWPRSQIGGLVSQRLSPRGALPAPNSNGSGTGQTKKTRRRVASMAQRRAANIRERRRMFNLNEAFDKLRRKVKSTIYLIDWLNNSNSVS